MFIFDLLNLFFEIECKYIVGFKDFKDLFYERNWVVVCIYIIVIDKILKISYVFF